jgi:hypothetical protein
MAVLESQHRPNMTTEDGTRLLCEAISAGILNDMGSGSNVDICVIRPGGVSYKRSYVRGGEGGRRPEGAGARMGALVRRQGAGARRVDMRTWTSRSRGLGLALEGHKGGERLASRVKSLPEAGEAMEFL